VRGDYFKNTWSILAGSRNMNCSEAQELLSMFYDEQLPPDVQAPVAEHVDRCAQCARQLSGCKELSTMTERLGQPQAPADLWTRLEERLDADATTARIHMPPRRSLGPRHFTAIAAAVAVAASIGFLSFQYWGTHGHDAVDFAQNLDQFRHDPAQAQQRLLATYDGKAVNIQEAASRLGYRPVVADNLPDGFSLEKTYVLKMPCCTCVQSVCRRDNGELVAIFEHNDAQPMWFGDRPVTSMRCDGKACQLVECSGQFVASWKAGKRHLTVVGARDVKEVEQLVRHLDEARQRSRDAA
jgi:hypothetical protein